MTNTVSFPKGSVNMVAHRGLSGLERENTNAAFVVAGTRSYWGIETDVHRTADGAFVVIHNPTTDEVAGVSFVVEDSTYESLSSLRLKDMDSSLLRADLRIPTLAEYIHICHRYGKRAVLELKSRFTPEELAQIVGIIREAGHLEQTVFISFHLENLISLRKQLPEQTMQYLTGDFSGEILEALLTYRLDLDIYYPSVTQELVETLHAKGLEINCWTCDDPEDAVRLASWGVDYITSNILE